MRGSLPLLQLTGLAIRASMDLGAVTAVMGIPLSLHAR